MEVPLTAQATISLSPLDHALQLVKAAGYRVTKPKLRKLTSRGPDLRRDIRGSVLIQPFG